MERNKNPESRVPAPDWDEDAFVTDDPEDRADDEPSPHLKPGEKTWVEAEEERRRRGEPPRHSLPGEPKLPHEVYVPPPPRRTGTGFFYRSGDEIPPTHPDHGPMHLIPRQQDGSFAAYYYCSKEELAAAGVDTPPPRRLRRDGFGVERQLQFIENLRDTASITDAARLVGISRSTVYNLLGSPDGAAFRAGVEEALGATDILLEATALERAVHGQEEIVYHQGQRVGVRWKYDNKLLMALLRARNPLRYAPLHEIEGWLRRRGLERPADFEGALDRLAIAETEWGRRLRGEGDRAPALTAPEDAPRLAEPAPHGDAILSTSSTLPAGRPSPSPRRGEGWGEGAPTQSEPVDALPPHPTLSPKGEGFDATDGVHASTSSTLPAGADDATPCDSSAIGARPSPGHSAPSREGPQSRRKAVSARPARGRGGAPP